MKNEKTKKLLAEQLRKMPIVQIACDRAGVARASFYRWKKQDKEFSKEIEKAIGEGENFITDMSETQLISLIKDKNFPAIQLWLKSHHPKYGNKIEIKGHLTHSEEKLSPAQKKIIAKALRLASLNED